MLTYFDRLIVVTPAGCAIITHIAQTMRPFTYTTHGLSEKLKDEGAILARPMTEYEILSSGED